MSPIAVGGKSGERETAVKDGRLRATASAARSVLCAGHARRLGGASPLCNLMEVKH